MIWKLKRILVEAGRKYRLDLSVMDSGCCGWQVAKIGVCEIGVTEASAQQMMSGVCMVGGAGCRILKAVSQNSRDEVEG